MNTQNTFAPSMAPRCTSSTSTRSRFNPRTWSRRKQVAIAALGALTLTALWAAFRPELLFLNRTVNEAFPTGSGAPTLVERGAFQSLAHHTDGQANIYSNGKNYTLRLAGFATSNGPDVHVYLTKGPGTDNARIKSGDFVDLGAIKGNIGDQNYALPTSFDPNAFHGVSIWCKRFGVNFAGATLASTSSGAQAVPAPVAASVQASVPGVPVVVTPVVVTTGTFRKIGDSLRGTATITENAHGERTLTLSNFQSAKGPDLHVYLVKAQDVKDSASVAKDGFVDLGALKSLSGAQTYSVPKDLDLWQYLAVTVWCNKAKVNFGTAPLHSPQN